jgi:hypothetical protein
MATKAVLQYGMSVGGSDCLFVASSCLRTLCLLGVC